MPNPTSLVIHPTLPPGAARYPGFGGAERYITGTDGLLSAAGFRRVQVGRLLPSQTDVRGRTVYSAGDINGLDNTVGGLRAIESPAADVDFFLDLQRHRGIVGAISILREWYARLIDDVKPSFVEVHNLQAPLVSAWAEAVAVEAQAAGVPSLHVCHNSIHPDEKTSFPKGFAKYVFVSEASRLRFEIAGAEEAADNDRVAIVRGGVDTKLFNAGVSSHPDVAAMPGVKFFGLARSVDANKGIPTLLEEYAHMMHSDPVDASLILCDADGELASDSDVKTMDALKRRAQELVGMRAELQGRIQFVRMPHSTVPSVCAAADVVVVPSQWHGEAFPLAVGEGVASHKVVVSTRMPEPSGQEDAIRLAFGPYADALLPRVDEPHGLARVMRKLVQNPEFRRTMSLTAAEAMSAPDSPFDLRQQQRGFAEIYSALNPELLDRLAPYVLDTARTEIARPARLGLTSGPT